MQKLEIARAATRAQIGNSRAPIVCSSFGKDAMLVLALAREVSTDIPVLWLRQHVTRKQSVFAEQVIMDWDLTVLGFGVNDWTIAQDETCSVIYNYNVNGRGFGIVHDVIEGEKCLLQMKPTFSDPITLPNDLLLMGWKNSDWHTLKTTEYPADGLELGNSRVVAPLRDWTDAEIWEATHLLGIPYNAAKYDDHDDTADPDNIIASTKCLRQGVCTCSV